MSTSGGIAVVLLLLYLQNNKLLFWQSTVWLPELRPWIAWHKVRHSQMSHPMTPSLGTAWQITTLSIATPVVAPPIMQASHRIAVTTVAVAWLQGMPERAAACILCT
jgi:hypothetical protein